MTDIFKLDNEFKLNTLNFLEWIFFSVYLCAQQKGAHGFKEIPTDALFGSG